MLVTCCKMRINVTQIKVEMTLYYFNNIYIGEKEIKEEKCWENEKKREGMRIREYLFFAWDASDMGCKKPFIGFTIWTLITHLKDE